MLYQYDPTAVCIQETLPHSHKTASLKNIHTMVLLRWKIMAVTFFNLCHFIIEFYGHRCVL